MLSPPKTVKSVDKTMRRKLTISEDDPFANIFLTNKKLSVKVSALGNQYESNTLSGNEDS